MQKAFYSRDFFLLFLCFLYPVVAQEDKIRILYLVGDYPVATETYMHEEIAALWDSYDIKIVSLCNTNARRRKNYFPYQYYYNPREIDRLIRQFRPHIMHTHWLVNAPFLEKLANAHNIPFTVRTHSFDVLAYLGKELRNLCKAANSRWCLNVLSFPSFKKILTEHGLAVGKITCCWPVVCVSRFYNPNQKAATKKILQIGAGLQKHGNKKFVDLAAMMKDRGFECNLYISDHFRGSVNLTDDIRRYNIQKGSPVASITSAEPEDMPSVYQQHDWVIYTSDTNIKTVGLPVGIAEAQASGIGVCWQELPGRREEQLEYLGGAGFVFKSLEELPAILEQPYPEAMRLAGLENAKKCDIEKHKNVLTQVWESYIASQRNEKSSLY